MPNYLNQGEEQKVEEKKVLHQSDIPSGTVKTRHLDLFEGLKLKERATDPPNPGSGESIIWQSDGTGAGDAGDIMIKINYAGTVKTGTIIDYSAL